MSLLLASWLLSQTWAWAKEPVSTSYRIYWSTDPVHWCWSQFVEVPLDCTVTECQGDIPEPPGAVVYIDVIGVNAIGPGPWDHGNLDGACPQ